MAGRPWVFKIPRDKPWAWPEVEYVENTIEMQGHFGQDGNEKCIVGYIRIANENKGKDAKTGNVSIFHGGVAGKIKHNTQLNALDI